jgi:hypothetical protein
MKRLVSNYHLGVLAAVLQCADMLSFIPAQRPE